MTAPGLPEYVRGFIERNLGAVEEIEILRLLEGAVHAPGPPPKSNLQ